MTLFVPALRLLMLALNMYDTYKVLKPPKASTRSRDGRPTERALSQRKRKMKGALAVWIVWCCYMIYESTVESIVSLFVPFYDSCKSLVLLFLIFTRARGAEPIFLHVIRPLLRPYAATLDAVADVGRLFGDAAFLVVAYPFNLVSEWWNTYWTPVEAEEEHEISHPISLQPGGGRHRLATTSSSPSVVGAVASSLYQIWHPPRAAYEEADDNPPPMPVPQTPESPATLKVRREMEEWRQYPPIPSAYPPTPLPLRFGAPSSPEPVPVISDEARKQMDEWRKYPPFPSAYPATPMTRPTSLNGVVASASSAAQFAAIVEEEEEEEMMGLQASGFGQSLPSPPELPGPGSVRGASDMRWNALGIYEAKAEDEDDAMDEDDRDDSEQEDDDSDDDFNVTLRTPKPLRTPMTWSRSKREEAVPLSRLSSVSSTTTTSPTSGRKRSRDLVSPAGSEGSTSAEETQPATVALVELTPSESDVDSSRSSGAEEEEEEDSVSEAEPVAVLVPTRKGGNGNGNGHSKRRKVVGDETPRRVQPKRGSRDTTPAPVAPAPRRTKSATSTTTAAPNRASSRIAASASAPPPAVASRVSRRGSNK